MSRQEEHAKHLVRKIGLLALTATGICSMLGASINVVPFMIQRNVPGIGPYVLPAFLFAAVPAIFAAIAYSSLASAMPRAGGSYIYASRGLNPYLGFIASFSQWFGLSIVIGVIAYIIVPFLRDVAIGLGWGSIATSLEIPIVRVGLALCLIWIFIYINIRGAKFYERTVIPLMIIMFALGAIVIVAGFTIDQGVYIEAVKEKGLTIPEQLNASFNLKTFLSAAAILFSSFIGFDAIAQAGGEAKEPSKALPRAIGLAILTVGGFYFLFTAAVYNTIPWQFVAQEALEKDISAPGLLSYVLPASLAVAILVGAAIALINDLPAMLLSVSRLVFAWSEDGIFPKGVSKVSPKYQTPVNALLLSGIMASVGVFGSHFAGDFFLGIDIMVTSMMVNFLLMCLTLITIDFRNPTLADQMQVIKTRNNRRIIGMFGVLFLLVFLGVHTWKDLSGEVDAWYFHSTWTWMVVMGLGSCIFFYQLNRRKKIGVDTKNLFKQLPEQ